MMEDAARLPSCDCRRECARATAEKIQEQHPEATDVKVEVDGYVFLLSGGERPALPISVTYQAPRARGGTRLVREKMNAIASFCPFCGTRYGKEED